MHEISVTEGREETVATCTCGWTFKSDERSWVGIKAIEHRDQNRSATT